MELKELTEAKKIETAALNTYQQAKAFREGIEKRLNKVAKPEPTMHPLAQKSLERRLKKVL